MNRGNERSYHHVLMREIMRGNRVDQTDADTVANQTTNATDVGFGLAGNADMIFGDQINNRSAARLG